MNNPFNLPDNHWALAQSKEDRVKRLILHNYDVRNIINICKVDPAYVYDIASKNEIHARDRGVSNMREFLIYQNDSGANKQEIKNEYRMRNKMQF